MKPQALRPPFIQQRCLNALGGVVHLRDPRARSSRPSLVPGLWEGERGYLVQGPFKLIQRYAVRPDQGVRFCDATQDPNEIHRTEDIVPGALTAAHILLPIEVLLPRFTPAALTVKFTDVARYGRPTRILTEICQPNRERISVTSVAFQGGKDVAEARIEGVLTPAVPLPDLKRRKTYMDGLRVVRSFFTALAIQSGAYFKKKEGDDFTYPFAFVASLPSAEMVRSYDGSGGFLNKLTFDFGSLAHKIPITGKTLPTVALEAPKTPRKSAFQRILAHIMSGLETYYEGTALVTMPPAG